MDGRKSIIEPAVSEMEKQEIILQDLGLIPYKAAWDYQEELMQYNLAQKLSVAKTGLIPATRHYFLLCEHNPVYTLGRNGNVNNILISEEERLQKQIEYYHINRGGDITFHGPGQIVGYPILDLEKFYTDLSRYIFELEEVIIRTVAEYGIVAGRSKGETGVWIDADQPALARKICAIGIRSSRWITMHGFALNVNTDLGYFNNIIPCGIADKKVTSMKAELGFALDPDDVKIKLRKYFSLIFDCDLRERVSQLQSETLDM